MCIHQRGVDLGIWTKGFLAFFFSRVYLHTPVSDGVLAVWVCITGAGINERVHE